MNRETAAAAIESVHSIEEAVTRLRAALSGESIPLSDRQYLSRCFDLLEMELQALSEYVAGMR